MSRSKGGGGRARGGLSNCCLSCILEENGFLMITSVLQVEVLYCAVQCGSDFSIKSQFNCEVNEKNVFVN